MPQPKRYSIQQEGVYMQGAQSSPEDEPQRGNVSGPLYNGQAERIIALPK